jgi:hypothetical protein
VTTSTGAARSVRSRRGDIATSSALLVVALCAALIGWGAVWIEVGLLTAGSGPEPVPVCAVDASVLVIYPVVSAVVLATGCWIVIARLRRQRRAWSFAAATVVVVSVVYLIAGLSAQAATATTCH